jgi:hypothetical protein
MHTYPFGAFSFQQGIGPIEMDEKDPEISVSRLFMALYFGIFLADTKTSIR